MCQECKGHGREIIEMIFGHPRDEVCGWCNGTGEVTPEIRGIWLSEKAQQKRLSAKSKATT
jgi:DnaJ-class molecular chaperone